MSEFLDPRFELLQPYVPGLQPQRKNYVKLNTNESPYPPSPGVIKAVMRQAGCLNRYPDPDAGELAALFSAKLGVKPDMVCFGNGSDELLAFIFQALCPHGAAFADLTYGFYPVYCRLYAVDALTVPLREDYSIDAGGYFDMGRTIFIANPNAPTGMALSRAQIEEIAKKNPASPVVVDEAYVDFGAQSAVPLLEVCDNLLIVGTFSKSRSLAGGRLGYAAGSARLIKDINRIRFSFNPYNLNRLTVAGGMAALEDEEYFNDCRAKIMATRARVRAALIQMGFECTDSLANFLFVRHPAYSGKRLYEALWERGVLVRRWDIPRIENHLRISVGTDAEMDVLLAALPEIFDGKNG